MRVTLYSLFTSKTFTERRTKHISLPQEHIAEGDIKMGLKGDEVTGTIFFLLIYAVICSDYVALAVVKFEYGKFLN
jgi:hypothetical protein